VEFEISKDEIVTNQLFSWKQAEGGNDFKNTLF